MAEKNFEEELQKELQKSVNNYFKYNKAVDENNLKETLVKDAEDFTLKWISNHSEEILIKAFGEEAVKQSRISPKQIGRAYKDGIKIRSYINEFINIKNIADGITAYYAADENEEENERIIAIGQITNGFLTASNKLVQQVPVSGPAFSIVVQELQSVFNDGFKHVKGRVAQLQYTEAMCNYYSGQLTLAGLYSQLLNIGLLDSRYYEQLNALLEMQSKMSSEGGYQEQRSPSELENWKNKGNEIYNNMTDEEKDEYGKQWPYGTTDETKENASDGANEAGSKQPPRDPLVIDLGKKGIELTNVDGGVHFDLDKNGFAEKTAWIGTEDGFLALDRNGNGIIDDGGELFGDQVDLDGRLAASGFEALKQLDDNVNSETSEIGDGVIDKNDSRFSDLRVWIDANHNGKTDSGELKTLDELGITSISLNHTNKNVVDSQTGTIVTELSVVTFKDGSTSEISEHWFEVKTYDTEERDETGETLKVESVEAFGNVKNLNSAIKEDDTGELGNLVEQFKSSTDYIEKRVLLKKILYFLTDAADINPNSRGGNMDARDLCVIEAFLGRKFVGVDGGSAPNVNAAPILKNVYADIERMYFNLLNKETVVGEYLSLILKRWNENGPYLDVSAFNSKVSEMIKNGENVENVLSGVASWLKQYDNAFGESCYAELSKEFTDYSELLNRVSSASVLLGGTGNDSLKGTNGIDIIYGDNGNDVLSGGSGNDILCGGKGNDVLDGGTGNDILNGGEGNDTYVFGKGYGNDTIIDSDGLNTLRFSKLNPNDILVNGTGEYDVTVRIKGTNDTLVIKDFRKGEEYRSYDLEFNGVKMHVTDKSSPFRHIYGGNGDDVLKAVADDSIMYGFGGDDTVYGSKGSDVIYGNEGNDTIYAGAGNDFVFGGEGNDILDGGIGDDYLYGGQGDDTYIFGKGYGTDIIIDSDGISTIQINDLALSELEIIKAGENAVISVKGTEDKLIVSNYSENAENYLIKINGETLSLKEQISENSENKFIIGTDDYDYIVNDSNNTDIFAGANGDRVLANGNNNRVFGDSGNDSLFGGFENDYISGGQGDDYINGGDGDDIIDGGAGNDFIDGGAGNDVYIFNPGYGADSIMDVDGANTIILGDGFTADGIKAYRHNWNDILITFDGYEDTLIIKNYCINENARNFTLVFADGTVVEAAAKNSPLRTIYGTDGSEYMISIYNDGITKIGKDGDDQLVGSVGNDYLYGDKGNDRLTGNAGNDVLDGGEGNDYLYGGEGNDTYIFKKGYGTDVIGDGSGTNTIEIYGYSASQIKAYRTNWNDITVTFEGSEDKIVIEGFFTSESNRNFYLAFNGGSKIHVTASNSPLRTIYGTDNSDYILAMDDKGVTIIGESGSDSLNGGNGADKLYGGLGDDSLYGNGGNDILDGGEGNDYLCGGAGNDTYIFNKGYGTDTINDGEGINTIVFGNGLSKDNMTVYRTNWNDLTVTFSGIEDKVVIQGYFGSENNRNFNVKFADGTDYKYNDEANPLKQVHLTDYSDWMSAWCDNGVVMHGDGGDDSLFGGKGNDTLSGGTGNDYLAGGEGDDTYIFAKGYGNDIVEDYFGVNSIVFSGIKSDEVTFSKGNSGELTANIAEDVLTIKNYNSENYVFEFADGITGTVDSQTAEFTEFVDDDEIVQNGAELLDSIYQNDTVITEHQFTETENTDIAEKNDLFDNDGKEVADKTDIQIMILTENMAAFNSEDNISDSLNIAGTEDITVSNQLFVNSQN